MIRNGEEGLKNLTSIIYVYMLFPGLLSKHSLTDKVKHLILKTQFDEHYILVRKACLADEENCMSI